MVVLTLRPFPSSITTYSAFFPASASTTGPAAVPAAACSAVAAGRRAMAGVRALGQAVCRSGWGWVGGIDPFGARERGSASNANDSFGGLGPVVGASWEIGSTHPCTAVRGWPG